ncbi:MAG: DUF1573 domain-containing protein [Planctomycetes bacterium]|nr:DUF1573 domain-containing protein [Planctomycetota bacterium]
MLAAPERRHDFGLVLQGDSIEHTFELAHEELSGQCVMSLKNDCGCTATDLKVVNAAGASRAFSLGDALDPEQRLQVRVTLDTSRKSGEVSLHSTLLLSGGGVLPLTLSGTVREPLGCSPNPIDFGRLDRGERGEFVASLTASVPGTLTMDTTALPPEMLASVSPSGSETWELEVALEDAGRTRTAYSIVLPLRLETSFGKVYEKSVVITAAVKGAIASDPEAVSFGLLCPAALAVVPRRAHCRISRAEPFSEAADMALGFSTAKGSVVELSSLLIIEKSAIINGDLAIDLMCREVPDVAGPFRGALSVRAGTSASLISVPVFGLIGSATECVGADPRAR